VKTFISPSQAVIDRHVEAGYASYRFRLIRLGFWELDGYTSDLGPSYSPLDYGGAHRTVAYAGGGVEIKGASVVLRALPTMMRHIRGLRVLVTGRGEEQFLARCRRYAPVVRLLGQVPNESMRNLFATADLTLLPSVWHENSPVVIFESYQAGTPVVGSRLGGIPELIREEETGYLFPANDADALAERAILHFARPPHERRRMRHACVREVRGPLAFERHIEGIVQVYREATVG
jgi:glycosyltransferase involved in cell wall biosynthesis